MGYAPMRLPRRFGPGGRTTEYPPNGWSPAEVERRILDEPVEWLYVFAPDGRQIARFRGTPEHVDLSDELKARSQGLYGESVLRDHLVVHNHPATDAISSFPPSPSDVCFAVERDLRELVVVSGGWRSIVRRPGDHWSTDEYELSRMIEAIARELNREHGASEEGTLAEAVRLHRSLRRLAEGGWIYYERTVSAGDD